jgi:hypothetical protein
MKYFNTFPKTYFLDNNNNLLTLTNLMTRIDVRPSVLNNSLAFYGYDIQDGETPDIIASKYYGDSYRYWLTLFGNQDIIDPQFDWPLSSNEFQSYLVAKYSDAAAEANTSVVTYMTTTVQEYRKTITTTDSVSSTTTSKTYVIGVDEYNSITPSTTSQTFPNGAVVSESITTSAVNIYDYEVEQNESKRNINLLNSAYTSQIEYEFKSLMGQ